MLLGKKATSQLASQLKASERRGDELARFVYFNRKFVWDVIKKFPDKNISGWHWSYHSSIHKYWLILTGNATATGYMDLEA